MDNNPPAEPAEETTEQINKMDSWYFESYAGIQIHQTMMKDTVRTLTYRDSMYLNKHLFKDKIVMDVGCGTGILSMFAAKAGAKRVLAVDCSDIIEYAKTIVKDNKLDHIITLIKGKVEEIELPDGIEKVDIIISEWMGYCLFFESMWETVLFARDKFLKPNGLIFPDKCYLYIAIIEAHDYKQDRINFWNKIHGFDMRAIRDVAIGEAYVDIVNPEQVVTTYALVKEINLNDVKKEDFDFEIEFILTATKSSQIHAVMAYFTVEFSKCHTSVWFSTGPGVDTHWRQTMFFFESTYVNVGMDIKGSFAMKQNEFNPRNMDFFIKLYVPSVIGDLCLENRYTMH